MNNIKPYTWTQLRIAVSIVVETQHLVDSFKISGWIIVAFVSLWNH